MTLTVDPRWTNGYGYRPVEVTVASTTPATNDHSVTIQLYAGWNRNVIVEQDLRFPRGSTSATTTVSLPSYQTPTNNYFRWEVWVDGVKDKDLSIERGSSMAWMGSSTGTVASLTFLVAGPKQSNRALVGTNSMRFEILTLELAKFPTQWIDYTSLDVVALSLGEAQQLAQQQPAAFDAIARWVRAGGQLWISDVGKELEKLPAVSKLFHLSDKLVLDEVDASDTDAGKAEAKDDNADKETTKQTADKTGGGDQSDAMAGWRPIHFRRGMRGGQVGTFVDRRTGRRRITGDPEVIARLREDPNFDLTEERDDPTPPTPQLRWATDSNRWYVEQALGLGAVRAFRGANDAAKFAQAPPAANPNAVANSDASELLPEALRIGLRGASHWDARYGMTPDSANAEFDRLRVPGVGRAPVIEFEVLITLFVLFIGPVNYWLLRRFKRLHLMVLTVPLAAAATTLVLFAYGMSSDGFKSRVRAYSYTTIDQRTKEAACWARLSYYSGLAPGDGLILPTDVAVFPIQPGWAADSNFAEERQLVWTAKEARLTRGWLNSRTPTQYLTVRARKSPHSLEVLDAGERLRVKNQLGASIKTLLVVGDTGQVFFGEDIADGGSAPLQPMERDQAGRRLNGLITENLPQAPTELATPEGELSAFGSRARYRKYNRYGASSNVARLSDNLASNAIASLGGLDGGPALELLPRSYVAITETGPEVDTGIPDAEEEASFHLIEGKW
jgi:hypothetical protein